MLRWNGEHGRDILRAHTVVPRLTTSWDPNRDALYRLALAHRRVITQFIYLCLDGLPAYIVRPERCTVNSQLGDYCIIIQVHTVGGEQALAGLAKDQQ